ncbi:MAG: hypothetical protein AAGH48_11325, partial [Pseudomonadota bacterium]
GLFAVSDFGFDYWLDIGNDEDVVEFRSDLLSSRHVEVDRAKIEGSSYELVKTQSTISLSNMRTDEEVLRYSKDRYQYEFWISESGRKVGDSIPFQHMPQIGATKLFKGQPALRGARIEVEKPDAFVDVTLSDRGVLSVTYCSYTLNNLQSSYFLDRVDGVRENFSLELNLWQDCGGKPDRAPVSE